MNGSLVEKMSSAGLPSLLLVPAAHSLGVGERRWKRVRACFTHCALREHGIFLRPFPRVLFFFFCQALTLAFRFPPQRIFISTRTARWPHHC